MKVTKAIKEYISDEVAARLLAASKVPELREEYFNLCETAKAELKALDEEINKKLEDYNRRYGLTGYAKVKSNLSFNPPKGCFPVAKALDEAEVELRNRKNKEINRILATLELGGTKDDLDRLLSEIK